VLKQLNSRLSIPISVDTCKSAVAEKATDYGAEIINDPSAVARRLSIPDRGLLVEGTWADVTVFDPAIIDKAAFENPHQLSVGVRHVFVNGVAVVRDGVHTGAKPGKIVRGPGYRPR